MEAQQVLPVFTRTDAPDVYPIMQLHRGHDGWISFHRKVGGKWQDLFNIKAQDLGNYFPQLLPTFETDSYFSMNGMWRAGYGKSRHASELGLPRAHRNNDSIRWLTCNYLDIDCYKLGIDVPDAIAAVVRAQDADLIPAASMLCRSGQGLWAMWFLAGEPGQPVYAWPEKLRLWCYIQGAIGKTFAKVGADLGAKDAARVTRIPGSINSKSGRRVDYWIQASANGNPFIYGLDEIAGLLGVEVRERHPAIEEKILRLERPDNALSRRGRIGQAARWLKARKNFDLLWGLRGTFGEGTRNNAVFVYASILRSQRLDEEIVYDECFRLFYDLANGKERYTVKDFHATMKSVKDFHATMKAQGKFGGMKNQTVADLLDVTPEESAYLDNWPPASRFTKAIEPEDPTLSQAEQRDRRRAMLKVKIDALGYVPSLRDLAAWLTDEMALATVAATVGSDLRALKISNPRGAAAKRRKRAQRAQRKFL